MIFLPTAPAAAPSSLPLACFLQLSNLALYQFTFQWAHLVDENDSVTVISLVQHAASS
jgi:hypothetical protein